jgi:hypothetical protein
VRDGFGAGAGEVYVRGLGGGEDGEGGVEDAFGGDIDLPSSHQVSGAASERDGVGGYRRVCRLAGMSRSRRPVA